MRLGLTLVSIIYFLGVFLPVLALPQRPAGISMPSSLAKRNDQNMFSDIEARSPPHMVTLKKRWGLGLLIRGIVWAIRKIVSAVKHAHHWAKAAHNAIKRKSESKHVQAAVKHADRGRKVAKGANKASNNMPNNPPSNGPNNGPNNGHRRRGLLDPRDEQVYKMKRSLVHQKRGLNRRMMRQLRERRSNTGFDELD